MACTELRMDELQTVRVVRHATPHIHAPGPPLGAQPVDPQSASPNAGASLLELLAWLGFSSTAKSRG